MATLGSRRIKVSPGDVLLINGYEVDASILVEMVAPEKRLLWAFVRNNEVEIQPVPYDESRVLWLAEEDLVRSETDQL
jgi:hypothetical protein